MNEPSPNRLPDLTSRVEVLYSRRSTRHYKAKPPPLEIVSAILDGACQAPSSQNEQPWRFLVIADPAVIGWMSARVRESMGPSTGPIGADSVYHGAPVVVLVLCPAGGRSADTRIAAAYLLLAAEAFGVGSCWLGDGRQIGKDVEACLELGISEGDTVAAAIALGYAEEPPISPGRRDPEIVRWIGPK